MKIKRDKLGRFVKGFHSYPPTEFKKGHKLGIKTRFKKGKHSSKKTEFKKIRTAKELRERIIKYNEKWRLENPEKKRAEWKANAKIKIPKGQICIECNEKLAKIKHHEDYSKPLEVDFLCYSCHNKKIKTIIRNKFWKKMMNKK